MSSLPFEALAGTAGFQDDLRFARQPPPVPEPVEAEDSVARAFEDGFAAGQAEVEAASLARAESEAAARGKIELALARLDAELTEALRQKLMIAVEALCEASLTPLALDKEALAARVERAAAMLARADDDKVLRLHPDDLRLVAANLPDGLTVLPDPALERGALRFETASGGVEDGPAHWRRAISEAPAQC